MTTQIKSEDGGGFDGLGLAKPILAAVAALGYEEPTPIQREAIPILLSGKDLIGQAGTGTGKTAAFALPLLDRLSRKAGSKKGAPRAVVLVPTRELAMQVAEAIHKYSKGLHLTAAPLYGGASMEQQIRALHRGVDVVIATPGRATDHLRRQTLDLSHIEFLALDEADEMLDMGFAEDIEAIIGATPKTRQTALFAATLAPRIAAIAGRHLNDPARVTIAREKREAGKTPRVRQVAYIVSREQKGAALGRVLDFEEPKSAIVFCRTRLEVEELTDVLIAHGYSAQALHGGMIQKQRDRVMQLFRAEKTEILVATDVAARGLDIEHVSHVISYDVPSAPEVYVHRIGRTGRIGREGVAITLVGPREQRFLKSFEHLTKQRIDIAALPTVADLRARRLDAFRESLRAELTKGKLDEVRSVVESLLQEFDVLDIAAAAVRMARDATDRGMPAEPAVAEPARERERDRGARPARAGRDNEAGPRSGHEAGPRGGHEDGPRSGRDDGPRRSREDGPRRSHDALGPMAVLRLDVGKRSGVGPGDIVGAITGEARVPSTAIGAIKVGPDFSLVEVSEELTAKIIAALRRTKIRGQQPNVQTEPKR